MVSGDRRRFKGRESPTQGRPRITIEACDIEPCARANLRADGLSQVGVSKRLRPTASSRWMC